MLTLDACGCSSAAEEVGVAGNQARRPTDGGEKDEAERAIGGAPARLPGGGGRGRRGGAFAPARFAPGGLCRRRRAAASRLGHGHGAVRVRVLQWGKRRGERERVASACFLSTTGA